VFVSYTAELAAYPPGHSFVDAATAGIRRVDAVPVAMIDFGARHDIPLEVCRKEILSSDVHLSLIGFRYGTLIPERSVGKSYTEFEFDVATSAHVPRLVFLIDEQTPIPPALVDHDRTLISEFRRRLQEGADHLATAFVSDAGRLEAAVSQALIRVGLIQQTTGVELSLHDRIAGHVSQQSPTDEYLDLNGLVDLLASYFRVGIELIDRLHAADILRGLEGSRYRSASVIEAVLMRTTNRRQRYFASSPGVPGVSEQLAVALALAEPLCRSASWAWGWDQGALERLEELAGDDG
jgi:Domain of unknown function (DUF4062)